MRTFIKRVAEFTYWLRSRLRGGLDNSHYEYFFTGFFGLEPSFYQGKRIIDIGCGPRGSLEWADQAAERIGLDPLANSYRHLGAKRHKMRYVSTGAESIPFADGHFDVVSSLNSLDHVEDVDAVIQEMCRVTKPGGHLLLITDVNHDPTLMEPLTLSWDVVDRFVPTLRVVNTRRFEKLADGMYQSLRQRVPYDDANPEQRYGILAALLTKDA